MFEYDIYAPWYDAQNSMDDLDFYLDALVETQKGVLEIGCGTGRLMIPIAREGYAVTGLDISKEMLRIAREKIALESEDVRGRINVVFADMKQFQLQATFGVALFGCNTFQHLLTNTEQNDALRCVHRHLEPGGLLFIQGTNVHFQEHEPDVLYYRGREFYPEQQHWVDVFYSFRYEQHLQLQQFKLLLDILGDNDSVTRKQVILNLRYFFPPEMERILHANGFEMEAIYGDFNKSPLSRDSQWVIIQARKAK